MSMDYIRKTYGVPAKRGGRLVYTDSDGVKFHCTIKSATNSGHLKVLVDDRVPGYRGRMKLHPTWHIEYLCRNGGECGVGGYCDDCHQPKTPNV
jgi:hypothetical protein